MNTLRKIPWLTACAVAAGMVLPAAADPTLRLSSFLGGNDYDSGTAIAADADGNTYIAGWTVSSNFPVRNAFQPALLDDWDVFVTKVDRGGQIAWSTYLGLFGSEVANDATLDVDGNLWLVGTTSSESIRPDVFVAKIDAGGHLLATATFGGSGWDYGRRIAPDPQGGVWIGGDTDSHDFPTTYGARDRWLNGDEAFLAHLDSFGSLIHSTFLGGSGQEILTALETDAGGGLVVAGSTTSPDFPVRNALSSIPGRYFAVRLEPSGEIAWATYLDAGGASYLAGLATDPLGTAYLVAYVAEGSFAGLEPPGDETTFFLVIGREGGAWGWGRSRFVSLPTSIALSGVNLYLAGGEGDLVATDLRTLREVERITIPGKTDYLDFAIAVWGRTIHGTGIVPVDSSLPAVHAFQPRPAGRSDAFLVRVDFNQPPDCSAAVVSPSTLWPPNGRMVPIAITGATDPDGDPVLIAFTTIHQDEPLTKKGEPDATGLQISRPSIRADRAGSGDGRVYHITFEASDPVGAACTGTVTVCVPHDQGKPACGDGGGLIDSTGATR